MLNQYGTSATNPLFSGPTVQDQAAMQARLLQNALSQKQIDLGFAGLSNQKDIAGLQAGASKDIAGLQAASAQQIAALQNAGATQRTGLETQSAQQIAAGQQAGLTQRTGMEQAGQTERTKLTTEEQERLGRYQQELQNMAANYAQDAANQRSNYAADSSLAGSKYSADTQLKAAEDAIAFKKDRFNQLLPQLTGYMDSLKAGTGNADITAGLPPFTSDLTSLFNALPKANLPTIDANPVYNNQMTQNRVNALRAGTDRDTATNINNLQRFVGQGFGSRSGRMAQLAAMYRGQGQATKVGQEEQLRFGNAQANTDALFRGQAAQSAQAQDRYQTMLQSALGQYGQNLDYNKNLLNARVSARGQDKSQQSALVQALAGLANG